MRLLPPHFWRPWKRHWLFVLCLLVAGPIAGYFLTFNRSVLFGLGVSVIAAVWLLYSDRERRT